MAKKPPRKDWSKEFLKYRIRSAYGSMVALAARSGVDPSVIKRALYVPYPKAERVIAEALGVSPADIWPSRYDPDLLRANHRLWRRLANLQSSTAAPGALVETDQTS